MTKGRCPSSCAHKINGGRKDRKMTRKEVLICRYESSVSLGRVFQFDVETQGDVGGSGRTRHHLKFGRKFQAVR